MQRNIKISAVGILATALLMISFQNCNKVATVADNASLSATNNQNNTDTNEPTGDGEDGSGVPGVGSFSVPTADAVVSRITNGLENNARPTAGNFLLSLNQVRGNLPKITDPIKATGYDQIQLLAYGACSDLITGGNAALMLTRYNVNPAATIANNQTALVAAGMRMLDQYTAGIASGSQATATIRTALTELVTTIAGTATNTSTIAFMSVCIAANTAGSALLGF